MARARAWADPYLGRLIGGRYLLERLIGMGGMGAVFEARHVSIDRRVAVKLMAPELACSPTFVERFRGEARSATAVATPGVVQVLDLDVDASCGPFLVLELMTGESLTERLARGSLRVVAAAAVALAILRTLESVHARGVVHRDLKPANVYLAREGDGSLAVKLLDFGIARIWSRETRLTVPGELLGTPRYMAPEQAAGRADADHRVDLYATGAILYECLSGQAPYDDVARSLLVPAVLTRGPTPIGGLCPALPPPVVATIERAMARSPAARFGSAAEMAGSLARAVGPLPPEALLFEHTAGVALPPASGEITGEVSGILVRDELARQHVPGATTAPVAAETTAALRDGSPVEPGDEAQTPPTRAPASTPPLGSHAWPASDAPPVTTASASPPASPPPAAPSWPPAASGPVAPSPPAGPAVSRPEAPAPSVPPAAVPSGGPSHSVPPPRTGRVPIFLLGAAAGALGLAAVVAVVVAVVHFSRTDGTPEEAPAGREWAADDSLTTDVRAELEEGHRLLRAGRDEEARAVYQSIIDGAGGFGAAAAYGYFGLGDVVVAPLRRVPPGRSFGDAGMTMATAMERMADAITKYMAGGQAHPPLYDCAYVRSGNSYLLIADLAASFRSSTAVPGDLWANGVVDIAQVSARMREAGAAHFRTAVTTGLGSTCREEARAGLARTAR